MGKEESENKSNARDREKLVVVRIEDLYVRQSVAEWTLEWAKKRWRSDERNTWYRDFKGGAPDTRGLDD